MKIFITGADGFIGSHLVEYIAKEFPKAEIFGTKYFPQVDIKEYDDKVHFLNCDVKDKMQLKSILERIKPDKIFHLAAQSYPTISWKDPVGTINDNIIGTINLFESVKELKLNPVILIACSSAEYGLVTPDEIPVTEEHVLNPLHPYGLSKVAKDNLAYQYFKNYGIKTIRARIFNTTGPRKVNDVTSDFAQQVAKIEHGIQKPVIRVGNLDAKRDITDGRDMVKAFWLATEKAEFGDVYNFCSNHAIKIQDILDMFIKMSKTKIEVEIDSDKLRPTDEPIIQGDNSKLVKKTGWKPEIKFEDTLKDTLNYWREKYSF